MKHTRIAGIFLSVVSILLVLFCIELGLRLFGSWEEDTDLSAKTSQPLDMRQHLLVHRRSDVPGLFYELTPDAITDTKGVMNQINSLGMRDREIPTEKESGVFRIAVLGDSFTYGWGVELQSIYLKKLEELLNEAAPENTRFEVLNFGVSGYNTEQEIILLKSRVVMFRPDMVIIGFVTNDILLPVSPLALFLLRGDPSFLEIAKEAERLKRLHQPRSTEDILPGWLTWSRFARMVGQRIESGKKGDFLTNYYRDEGRWQNLEGAFREAGTFLKERNITSLVVIFPSDLHSIARYPRREIHRKLHSLFQDLGFQFVDLLDVYLAEPEEKITLDAIDPHPSPYGHEIAAREVFRKLADEGFVPMRKH